MKRYWPVLLFSILAAVVYADTPPPVSLQSILKAAPKAVPIGSDTHLTAMKGSTLVYVNATSIKPAVATTSSAGIVKVGTGLAVTEDGTLNNTGMAGVASFKGRGGAVVPATGDYSISQITGASTVAATGSYTDLTNKPTIPAAQVQANWGQTNAAAVDYIQGKPTIPTALSQLTQDSTHRTVTDAEKATWNTVTASVNSVNGQTATVVLTATDVGADPLGSATSVQTNLNAHTGATNNPHSVTKTQVGLGNVDDTSDAAKPISTATQAALNLKANISSLGTAAAKDIPASGNASATQVVYGTDTRLSDARTPLAHTQAWSTITGTPTTLAGYGISDAYTKAFLDSALAGKLSDAPSDGNSYARKNGAWSPFVGGVQPFANISAALRANGITTPSVTSAAPDGTHGVWMKNTVPYTGARTGGAIFHNMTTMNYCETDNNCKRFGSGNSSGGITALTGDITASGTGSVAATLANSGATAGTYTNATVTVNGKGIVTSASSGATPIGGTVGSTADRIPVASGTGGSTLKASTVSIDPTTGATTVPKQSGVADGLLFYNGNSTETTGAGFVGPPTTMATSYYLQLPATAPTSGQTIVTGTPATQTVNGVSSTVVPVSYATAATSGTYTPTVTNVTNTSGLTPYLAHWQRIGNEVSVWGQIDVSVTAGGSQSSVLITLPPGATSTFTDAHDLEGIGTAYPGSHSAIAQGDTSTGKANLVWNDSTSGSLLWKYSFAYTVK